MNRVSGWEKRLFDFIKKIESAPFKWGEHDCCMFAGNCIKEMTGDDVMSDFRDKYDTARGAIREINRTGGLEHAANKQLGESIPINSAQRGDLILYKKKTVGICLGSVAAIPSTSGGVEYIGRDKWQKAWRV